MKRKHLIPEIIILTIFLGFLLVFVVKRSEDYIGIKSKDFFGNKRESALAKVLANQNNVTWSTGTHTAAPVPLGALGPSEYISKLHGIVQNTKIAEVMKEAIKNKVNVILVIGDGMGVMHMSIPIYMNIAEDSKSQTYFEKIMNEGECGLCLTNMASDVVTGSAAAGTAIACGVKTRPRIIGLDPSGKKLESALDVAEKNNMRTALITDTKITHATPAVFYANISERGKENEIASQLLDYEIEILLGGGAQHFIPESTEVKDHVLTKAIHKSLNGLSTREDKEDLITRMNKKGYEIACNKDELLEKIEKSDKILGLFAADGMNATVDRDDENTGEPGIDLMSELSLRSLAKSKNGYFVMIECGRIDWESHRNDAGSVLKEVVEMDRVLKKCYDTYKKDPDNTLLIFTADHETGGIGLSYSYTENIQTDTLINNQIWKNKKNMLTFDDFIKLKDQKMSFEKMINKSRTGSDLKELIEANTPYKITKREAVNILRHEK